MGEGSGGWLAGLEGTVLQSSMGLSPKGLVRTVAVLCPDKDLDFMSGEFRVVILCPDVPSNDLDLVSGKSHSVKEAPRMLSREPPCEGG